MDWLETFRGWHHAHKPWLDLINTLCNSIGTITALYRLIVAKLNMKPVSPQFTDKDKSLIRAMWGW